MTQNNSESGNPDPSGKPGQPPSDQPTAKPTKKKKRRLLLKTAIALVVLIVLLVVLAPSILSTGMVRGIVVGQINSSALNGKLEIKDWSFGWLSGVHIEGVKLDDANNEHLLSVAQISSPISLLKAATGNIDLGNVTITGVDFNAVIDSAGELNFLKALKPSNKPPSNQPSKLPNVKGTIHLQNVTGTFQDDPNKVTVGIPQQNPLNVNVTIKDINQPIEDSVDLGLQLDEKNFVLVKVNGTVSAIQNNLVDADHLAANQTIELSQGDLAAVSQLLHSYHLNLDVTGTMNGKITATVNTLDNVSADVGIDVADLTAGGKQLAGDTVALRNVRIGVKASLASTAGKNAAIKLDMPITLQSTEAAQADQITVHADVPQDSLQGTADVLKAIAGRLGKSPASGTVETASIPGAGDIKITADLNVAGLVGQVPHLLHLERGTSLTSGRLLHQTTITLANGQATIATQTQLKDFSGTNAGTPVRLNDIETTAGLTAVGGYHPDVRDVKLSFTSAFASIQGGGETLGRIKFQGSSDLKSVQQQISQVIDLDSLLHAPAGSHVAMGGTVAFDAHTDGDLTADQSNVGFGADFSATGVHIDIPGRRTIDDPKLTAAIGGILHHTAKVFVEGANALTVAIQSPAINFAAGGDVNLAGKYGVSIPSFGISQGSVDLRLLQEEFGGALSLFVPKPADGQQPTLVQRLADNSVRVAAGSLTISGKGRFGDSGFGFDEPLQIKVQPTDLTLVDELGTAQTAHVPAVSVVLSGSGAVNDKNVASIKNLTVTAAVGTADAPLLAMEISSDATVGEAVSVPRIELTKCDGDLAGLQSAFGPLLPLVMPQTPQGAGSATKPSVVQMVAQNLLVCTSGKMTGSMLASYDGTTLTIQKPLAFSIANLTLEQRGSGAVVTPINNQTVTLAIGGSVSAGGGQIHANLPQLYFQMGDELKVQGDAQTPLDFALAPSGTMAASGTIQLAQADLPKLLSLGALVLPPEQMASLRQLKSGLVAGTIRLEHASAANKVSAEISVNSLTVGKLLNNENAHLLAVATLEGDMSAVHDVTVGVDTSFAKKLSITNGQIVLATRQGDKLVPVGLFDKLQSVNVEADEVDLAKVDALVNLLFNQAAAPAPGEKVIVAAAPPQVTSGTATLKVNVSRAGNATTANVAEALVHNLAIKSGNNATAWPNDINAQLSAQVDTRPDATGQTPVMDQLVQASVTALSVDTGIGTTVGLTDQKPIVVSNLSDPANMSVQAAIQINGDLARLAKVAETFSGAKPNSYPYQGQLNLNEAIAKSASDPRLHLRGGGAITKFIVMGQPGPKGEPAPMLFSEDNVTIQNPLDYDFKTFSVLIDKANPIVLALNSTAAAGVSVSGTINDIVLRRQIADDNPVSLRLSYDLAKLWPIVKPLLSPEQQKTYADMVISGKQSRQFKVSGSLPADKPFGQAVAMLKADGYLTIDSVSTQGITVRNFDLPIDLTGGILRTVYADQPEGSNAPHPATCNGGTLDLGVVTADLRTDPMLLSVSGATDAGPHYILKDVSINPTMSKNILGKVLNNPAFVGAKQARGLVSVSVLQVDRLPLSGLMTQDSSLNKGTAEVQYSVKELQLGSELLAVFGNASVSAEIDNADVKFARGKVTEDTTMMIDRNKPLRFAGVVVLATEQFAPMTAYVPTALFAHLIPINDRQYIPDQVVVPMKGDMNHPKLELDQTIAQLIKDAAKKAILNGLLQGLQHVH
jgi:hypothetical protein